MPSALSPQTQYMAYVAIASLGAFALGAYVFLPDLQLKREVREFLQTDWKYLGVAWVLTFGVNELAKYHVDTAFTDTIYAMEGATVGVFQTVTARPLTMLFVFVYLVGFPFVVLFTYFKLKAHDREQAYRYAAAYACLVLLAAPFFVFVPVKVTGYSLVSVRPLLYDLNSIVMAGTFATDTLMKSFPSLHTGLSTLAAIFAWKTGDRLYAWTVTGAAACIVVSTFYLGIHWLLDAAFAVVLVLIAHEISQRIPLSFRLGALRRSGRGAGDRD
ncbi:phosphatase PAP2 family protein [Salarchaeum japonicum]|mgnify:CR=1 FL=1|uniref:phosphatase PAP2 family protein n=1 Tax=Salarchaeum japonicum TaxID=555573 RepID=UPI003C732F7C